MNIAIIPARGGSKRIPKKNIKNFCGKPIIAYSIENALKSKMFDKVIVSTDSEEIASVAKTYGAEIPFIRPKSLADDITGTDAVVYHALKFYLSQKIFFKYACCIYATAPLLQNSMLIKGLELLETKNASYTFPVTKYDFSIFRSLKLNDIGFVEAFYPQKYTMNSQNLPTAFHDAGVFYFYNVNELLKDKEIVLEKTIPIIVPNYLVQDIDTIDDWIRAELIYKSFI